MPIQITGGKEKQPQGSQTLTKIAIGQRFYNFGFTDSLLQSRTYTRPRYEGSKLIGKEINVYTDYTQLSAEDFSNKLGSLSYEISPPFGGDPISIDSTSNFIKTTKPIDGTFPFSASVRKGTGIPLRLYFNTINKGNLIFPVPGKFSKLSDLILQNGDLEGELRGLPSGIQRFNNVLYCIESQLMGGYRRDRSFGKNPVIEVKTNTIYEFDWGGGAYPEVERGGGFHLVNILNIDRYGPKIKYHKTTEADSLYDEWDQNLKRSLYKNDLINLIQYSTLSKIPAKNEVVLEPGIGVPVYSANEGDISGSYYLPVTSSEAANNLKGYGSILLTNDTPRIIANGVAWRRLEVSSSLYTTSSNTANNTDILNELSTGISNGDRYFVSFYSSLGNTTVGELNQIGNPTEIKGTSGTNIILLKESPDSSLGGEFLGGSTSTSGSVGILVWKAQLGPYVTVKPTTGGFNSFSYSGIQSGGFYREYSIQPIKDNFKQIVETIGIKPST